MLYTLVNYNNKNVCMYSDTINKCFLWKKEGTGRKKKFVILNTSIV